MEKLEVITTPFSISLSISKYIILLSLLLICLEWEEERVSSASLLKLIYHGRFLHGSVTLSALSLPGGKTTVMHLVTRENLPEPNSNGKLALFYNKNDIQ